jgi:type VI secretion system secreted protein Hcp
MKKRILAAVVSVFAYATAASAATPIIMTVQGAHQGKFKGETVDPHHTPGAIPVAALNYEIKAPTDPATGMVSGKRQHSPVVITKAWGASSPQFLEALVTNEVLSNVTLEFYRASPTGMEEVESTMKLTDAQVVDAKEVAAQGANQQEISLTFRKIEITNADGTTFTDDWSH